MAMGLDFVVPLVLMVEDIALAGGRWGARQIRGLWVWRPRQSSNSRVC
jgi:hypothetical protein